MATLLTAFYSENGETVSAGSAHTHGICVSVLECQVYQISYDSVICSKHCSDCCLSSTICMKTYD
jgi:hypothetical protein